MILAWASPFKIITSLFLIPLSDISEKVAGLY